MRSLVLALVLISAGFAQAREKPAVPISISFHQVLFTKGTFVAQLHNEGETSLFLHARFDRVDGSSHHLFSLLMTDSCTRKVGADQEWAVKSGDILTLTSQGYQGLQVHVP